VRKLLIGTGLVLVIAILVFANVRAARRRGVQVDVEAASRRDLVAEVSGSGRVEARRSVDVVASVVGKVVEVAVEEGERVDRGQLILRIDPADRQALLEQARAALASASAGADLARAELRQSELELERVRGLVRQSLGSSSSLEGAETDRDVRRARLAAAEQEVRDARARVEYAQTELSRTVVRAEIPGVVVRLAVEEGENVLAGDLYNRGSAIVTVADLSEMEAQILVDETEVVKTRVGQKANVEIDAFPDLDVHGTVLEVGNSAYEAGALGTQEAKDFRVRILLEDVPDGLRPGLSARADIVTDTREDALSVPIESLAHRDPAKEAQKRAHGGRKRDARKADAAEAAPAVRDSVPAAEEGTEVEGVFVVVDGEAVFRPVKTGIAGERHFEVLAGLEEGTPVVRGPFDALRRLGTGDKVRVRTEKERAKADAKGGEGAGSGGKSDAPPDEEQDG
jgi:HlyD family secretion protein